jgi:hypothetical protein
LSYQKQGQQVKEKAKVFGVSSTRLVTLLLHNVPFLDELQDILSKTIQIEANSMDPASPRRYSNPLLDPMAEERVFVLMNPRLWPR